jgi:hypothetical protein
MIKKRQHAVLRFYLPYEREELDLALNGAKYRAALDRLDEWLRGVKKYGGQDSVGIDQVRDKIGEFME